LSVQRAICPVRAHVGIPHRVEVQLQPLTGSWVDQEYRGLILRWVVRKLGPLGRGQPEVSSIEVDRAWKVRDSNSEVAQVHVACRRTFYITGCDR
jgi:hypothetical protein